MDRGTRNLFALLLVAVVAITGGAALILQSDSAGLAQDTFGGDDRPLVTGVIVEVEAVSLSDVRGFTLRTAQGELLEFSLARLENGADFPPGHLAEHQATAEQVIVQFEVVDGVRFAVYLGDDAPLTSPTDGPGT